MPVRTPASPPARIAVRVRDAPARQARAGRSASGLWAQSALVSDAVGAPPLDRVTLRLMGLLSVPEARNIERRLRSLDGVVSARVDEDLERVTVSAVGRVLDPAWLAALLADHGVDSEVEAQGAHAGGAGSGVTEGPARRASTGGPAGLGGLEELLGRAAGGTRAGGVAVWRRFTARYAWRAVLLLAVGGLAALAHGAGRVVPGQIRAFALNVEVLVALLMVTWAARTPLWVAARSLWVGEGRPSVVRHAVGLGLLAVNLYVFLAGGEPHLLAGPLAMGGALVLDALGARLTGRVTEDMAPLRAALSAPAEVVQVGGTFSVSPALLRRGDLVVVRAGGAAPVDGVVEEGQARVVSLEALGGGDAREVGQGDTVRAGQVVEDGAVAVRALAPASRAALARLLARVDGFWTEDERLLRALGRAVAWAAALGAVAGAAIFLVRWVVDGSVGSLSHGAVHALAAAAAALAPIGMAATVEPLLLVGAVRAARRGVVFRSATSLSRVAAASRVWIEPCGVLTEARPALRRWVRAKDAHPARVMRLLLGLTGTSTWPEHQVLADLARGWLDEHEPGPLASPRRPHAVASWFAGVDGVLRGQTAERTSLVLGDRHVVGDEGIHLGQPREPVLPALAADVEAQGDAAAEPVQDLPDGAVGRAAEAPGPDDGRVLYLLEGGRVLARFHLSYPMRADARRFVQSMHAEVGLVTSLEPGAAARVAQATGARVVRAGASGTAIRVEVEQGLGRGGLFASDPLHAFLADEAPTLRMTMGMGPRAADADADVAVAAGGGGALTTVLAQTAALGRRRRLLRAAVGVWLAGAWGLAALDLLHVSSAVAGGLGVSAVALLAGARLPSLPQPPSAPPTPTNTLGGPVG